MIQLSLSSSANIKLDFNWKIVNKKKIDDIQKILKQIHFNIFLLIFSKIIIYLSIYLD